MGSSPTSATSQSPEFSTSSSPPLNTSSSSTKVSTSPPTHSMVSTKHPPPAASPPLTLLRPHPPSIRSSPPLSIGNRSSTRSSAPPQNAPRLSQSQQWSAGSTPSLDGSLYSKSSSAGTRTMVMLVSNSLLGLQLVWGAFLLL